MTMTREQFREVVKEMQAKGVPLTMPNLMVRTELPRAMIEEYLDALQRDGKVSIPGRKPGPAPRETEDEEKPSKRDSSDKDEETGEPGFMGRVRSLQKQIMGDMMGEAVKSRLGLSGDKTPAQKKIVVGAVLGLLFPPAALLYAAPWVVATVGSIGYLVIAFALSSVVKIPILGPILSFLSMYILAALHLAGALYGAGYAWRFNTNGRREPLLPPEKKK